MTNDELDALTARLRHRYPTLYDAIAALRQERDAARAEVEALRNANSTFASEAICHGDRKNDLWTCPQAPCDHCLQWQRRRAELAESGFANARVEIEALRHDIERHVQIAAEQAQEVERLLAEQRRVFELIYAPWAKHDFECVRSPEYCLLCRLRAALGEGA